MSPAPDVQGAQANDDPIAGCPRCEASATRSALPAALCPACLLALALHDDQSASADSDQAASARYRVLTVLEADDDRTTYLGEQCWPSRLLVTIDVVRAGAVTGAGLVARLTALKRLADPGTARIIDTLVGASGDCCVVAEYVPGLPLDDYCARNDVPQRDRLRLLSDVCVAVEHAHEAGIVHGRLDAKVVMVNGGAECTVARVTAFSVCDEPASTDDDVRALERMAAALGLGALLAGGVAGHAAPFTSAGALREAIEAERARGSMPATT